MKNHNVSIEIQAPMHAFGGAGGSVINLADIIKNHVKSIDELQLEVKLAREMFTDSFANNPTYREHDDRVKEASKARSSVKMQITKQPSVANLEQKVKDLRFDLNEKKKTLSDLLGDYKEQTGAKQLELFGGQVVDIVSTVKIVRKGR